MYNSYYNINVVLHWYVIN